MKIGFAQFDCKLGDKKRNIEIIEKLVAKSKADILVFPELSTTGYSFSRKDELAFFAERIPNGITMKTLIQIATRYNCLLIVGMAESIPQDEGDNQLYDTTVVISPYGYLGKCQKMHLFLKEKEVFLRGETNPLLISWKGIKIGIGICYDYMFPEYWRTLALKGADLFCNTANFVYNYGFDMMRARSIENGVFSITCNRIGEERNIIFRGGSQIIDNRGNKCAVADNSETVQIIDANIKQSRNKKWNPYNDLFQDRRPEMYKNYDI